ncbi:MAG: undecaprenyldiphospho-muramoylpentapeptide beta-N-acetylglucosaminyltransferase, partial [Rhodospirillales bacterium]|nr:undecaprenyldiphospho-muramoylpentapeptide beta-N-acetylglucosaminyltransferase [Rhodospirillales bacterium]
MTEAKSPLVVLAAGGTGGHVFPAEALAVELKSRGCRLVLITDLRGGSFGGSLDSIETHHIRAAGVVGKNVAALLKSAPELAIGTWQARSLLKKMQPDAVVGFGGYASVPTMLAAEYSGIKTAIHEQNAVLGRANRLLAAKAGKIATSFAKVKGLSEDLKDRQVVTGMPVRPRVVAMRDVPYPALDDRCPINILVLGGSQGASIFSEVLPEALSLIPPKLRARINITQQCRPENIEETRSSYRGSNVTAELSTFFDDVPERMAKAHLVISRSGASSVAEIAAIGRPAMLVPYPFSADDHQTANAYAVAEAGAGWLMPQPAFTPLTI